MSRLCLHRRLFHAWRSPGGALEKVAVATNKWCARGVVAAAQQL
jgi:hypothetical protein